MKHLISQIVVIITKVRTGDSTVTGIMIYTVPDGTRQLHYSGRCRIDAIPALRRSCHLYGKRDRGFAFKTGLSNLLNNQN